MPPLLRVLCALGVFCASRNATAHDRRIVEEPRIPPVCQTLDARGGTTDGRITPQDEGAPDTDRIQAAIDKCEAGRAVVLQAGAAHAVFLAGPLRLQRGVTLLVARATVLVASRDPRAYDVRDGSCGVVDNRGGGCRPFIQVSGPDNAIMGDGAIDGRGGAPLTGQQKSWWDLAQDAKV